MLGVKDGAALAGVSESTLRRDGDDGVLPMKLSRNKSRSWRWFREVDLLEYRRLREVR